MVLFALSCVGLLLFLWLSFGGTIPLGAQGYRINVSFPDAQDLATQADVRIAGVNVGKVVSTELDPKGNRTMATLQIQTQYEPIRENTHAILRTKTILGETYVQLIPGTGKAAPIPDGGTLPRGQVQSEVQLSDIYNAFDPTTRHAFQVWQQQLAKAISGNDQNLNDVLGNLPSFAADATDILQVLDVQHEAVVSLVQNGGTVFGSLGANQTALRNLITSAETTFATTAANNNKLAQTFQVFPTFLNETKATMAKLQTFSVNTDPLIKELNPVAKQLGPTLHSVQELSPPLRHLFTNLGPLITVSQTGLPAVSNILTGATPMLGVARDVPRAAQPDPRLAVRPSAADLGLHLKRRRRHSRPPRPRSRATASATTCASSRRSDPRRCRSRPTATPTTAGTRIPGRSGSQRRELRQGQLPRRGTARTRGAGGDGSTAGNGEPSSTPGSEEPCWVAPTLPGAKPGQIPHLLAATYPDK